MNVAIKNFLLTVFALLVLAFLFWYGLRPFLSVFNRTYEYRQTAYQKNHTWEEIEVGTIIRFPAGKPIPTGRYAAVIATRSGDTNDTRMLLTGPLAENPPVPKFISATNQTVVYEVWGSNVTLDLQQYDRYPLLRTFRSP